MQYCPGKMCNPLVDIHVSTFMHQVNEEKASRGDQNLEMHPQTFFPHMNNVLDIKNLVMLGLYLQHPFFKYHPIFTQYSPGKKCNPLVDNTISTFMHQIIVEKASNGCQNPVKHPQCFRACHIIILMKT
jgi:hypothetical protein